MPNPRDPHSERRTSALSSRQRMAASVVILVILLPAWLAVALAEEDFPLTAAVMFARDVGGDRPRYRMEWTVEDEDGERVVEPARLGLHPRHFFLHFYGPDGVDSPYPDTPRTSSAAAFDRRMEMWFGVFVRRYERTSGRKVERARLVIRRELPGPPWEREIGVFEAAAARFDRAGPR